MNISRRSRRGSAKVEQLGMRVVGLLALTSSLWLLGGCGGETPRTGETGKRSEIDESTKADDPAKTAGSGEAAEHPAEPAPVPDNFADFFDAQKKQAASLFAQHCAACHGKTGDGRGVAGRFLFPKPRDFRRGLFRLVSTANGIPTRDDLRLVLKRGMPGSAMPPWPTLTDAEMNLLAEQVVEFRREGVRAQEIAFAKEDGEEPDMDEINELAGYLTEPGTPVEVPEIPPATPEAVASGKQLYNSLGCVKCHGKAGRGDGQEKMVDAEGLPTRPRDLTKGIFKGSPDPRSIYIRTQAGMPGTPMPATRQATPAQISNLVHYVLSLSDEDTRAATVLNREKIVAAHVDALPDGPAADAWSGVPSVRLRMTPLWWRDDFEPNLDVQAVHNGESIALRLSWNDDQADTHALRSEAFEDAVAVELYRGDAEPFVGMGAVRSDVDAWMWDADRQQGDNLENVNPDVVVDVYPFEEAATSSAEFDREATKPSALAGISLPARAVGNPIVPGSGDDGASALTAAGPGSVTFRPAISQLVTARGEWLDGRWAVVMTRPLAVPDGAGVPLEPGAHASVAFAVWNGSRQDRDGQKLITIWQDLVLE